jgi:hypothetical protein
VIISTFWNGIAAQLQTLFDGSDTSTSQLVSLIADGKLFSQPNILSSDVSNNTRKVTYGYLVPIAWTLSNENLYPFVLDAGVACKQPSYFDKYIAARVCYNGKVYFLLNQHDSKKMYDIFELLPGNDQLRTATYGLSTGDIVGG